MIQHKIEIGITPFSESIRQNKKIYRRNLEIQKLAYFLNIPQSKIKGIKIYKKPRKEVKKKQKNKLDAILENQKTLFKNSIRLNKKILRKSSNKSEFQKKSVT